MFKLIEIGLKEVDVQHSRLIEYMNELQQAMKESPSDRRFLVKTLKKLRFYSLCHFNYEEHGMKLYNYPKLSIHLDQHLFFNKKLTEIEQNVEAGASFNSIDLLVFLRQWFLEHIAKSDAEYVAFIMEYYET